MKILQPGQPCRLPGNYYPHLFQRWLFVLCLFHCNMHQREPRTPVYHSCQYLLTKCGYMRDCFPHFQPRCLRIGYFLDFLLQKHFPFQYQIQCLFSHQDQNHRQKNLLHHKVLVLEYQSDKQNQNC